MAKMSVVAQVNNPAGRWIPPSSARVAELSKLKLEKTEEIIALEKAGVQARPRPLTDSPAARAARMLDGVAEPAASDGSDSAFRLHQLRAEVEVINGAIELGIQRVTAEKGERAQFLASQNASAWKALQRQRALAVMALFKANRQIGAMRAEILGGCSGVNLPLDGFDLKLFGAFAEKNVTGHWPREFLKQVVKAGLITEKDISDNV
ncbi:hypothetical protein ACO2JO_01145 [Leptospira interrogans]